MEEEPEEEGLKTDIALFWKGDFLAILACAIASSGGAIVRVDSRHQVPEVALFDDCFSLMSSYDKAINTSIKRGWTCFHRGKPNVG